MYAVSITEDELFDALGVYLAPYLPAGGVAFKSQANRTSQPPDPSIELTPILRVPLNTPVSTYDPEAGTQTVTENTRIDIQADFRGEGMGDVARAVKAIWRSISAPSSLQAAAGIKDIAPLYCSDELQSPFITGERQYAERWTVTLTLQYNADVTIPQAFFDSAVPVQRIAADVIYPVE